jgi:4-alpha-glucanotransferase
MNSLAQIEIEPTMPISSARNRFNVPFPTGYRASGVLMHVTSLPSPFGIGDLGPAAFKWIDHLAAAGQSWWQVLPLGPTGFGHSPYQMLSSFAANPLIVSPEMLLEEDLLEPGDCDGFFFSSGPVDFEQVIPFKERLLVRAWRNFQNGARADLRGEFERFLEEKGPLQEDTALFLAVRSICRGMPLHKWPTRFLWRDPETIARAREELEFVLDQFRFGQFLVLRQWKALRDYAHKRGIRVLGDLPIFVSPDSADVWANPELFMVDDQLRPRVLAGVPPDYFSSTGQLWGNPVYDWEAHRLTNFQWWISRIRERLDYIDAVRIDHFRGFEASWHVPAGATTAASGQWVPGPGAEFFEAVHTALDGLPLLAEDLGFITPAVTELRDQFQIPGMRVLQFGFNGDLDNPHLSNHCIHNSVVYTGTHDNDTTRGWYDMLPEDGRQRFWNHLRRTPGKGAEAVEELTRSALESPSALAVTPFQDLLGLGSEARMNIPGRGDGQWRWRCPDNELLIESAFQRLHNLTESSGRFGQEVEMN